MITFEITVRELQNNKEARVELPNSRYIEELTEAFGEGWIDNDYEIVDVEDDYNIFYDYKLYGYETLDKLNKLAERIEESCSDQHSLIILRSASEAYTDIEEVLEILEADELELYEDMSPEDLAEMYVEDGLFGDVNDKLIVYIDYEKLGRDIMLDGNYYETRYGILETRQ